MEVYKPPVYPTLYDTTSIFLAGSIEMDKAKRWQDDFVKEFEKLEKSYGKGEKYVLLNPRRDDWDSSWKQEISNAQFYQQVEWELTFLERADYKVFYFAENTMSPVTLLELGRFSEDGQSFVLVEDGYLRKGNVDIFCHRYRIPVFNSIEAIIKEILL